MVRELAREPNCADYRRSELAREPVPNKANKNSHPDHPFHGSNLRKRRYSESGRPYLVTSVTNHRQKLFATWQAGRPLALEFNSPWLQNRAETLAWVIMPDHFHWLISLQDYGDLPEIMQRSKSRSAIALNLLQGQGGRQVWQKGYYDHAVRAEEDIVALARYVVANPIRARLVAKLNDYPLWDAVWLP